MLNLPNYTDKGDGTPVLLLHGWGCSLDYFAPLEKYLLENGYRVIALDFPGHGKTPEPDAPIGMSEYAKVTLDLLDFLGVKSACIVAHSFGARVALVMASAHPERFSKLLLTGAAGLRPKRGFGYYCRVYFFKIGKFLSKQKFINKLLKLDERAKKAGSEDYRNLSPVMKGTFVKVVNEDLTPLLKKIKAPTLLVWGENDQATPLAMGEQMQKDITDSALIVFRGCTHYAFLEDIVRFCAITGAFLGGRS